MIDYIYGKKIRRVLFTVTMTLTVTLAVTLTVHCIEIFGRINTPDLPNAREMFLG